MVYQESIKASHNNNVSQSIYDGELINVLCRTTQMMSKPYEVFRRNNAAIDYSFSYILLEASLFLVITRILQFLLKPFRQPKVISDAIAGIIVGPSVLGRSKLFASHVFPQNARFMVRNLGLMGFMYFLFITGVKMDLGVIKKAGKKQWSVALVGVILPHMILLPLGFATRKHMDKELAKISSIGGVSSAVIITTFPVIYNVLRDLNLLSSEIGRLALSTVIISDCIGLIIIAAFEAAKQGEARSLNALYYLVSLFALSGIVVGGVPQLMTWIKRRTPEGRSLGQNYVTIILLGVFVIGFMTDFIGVAIGNGPLWLGLAIPDGPPIGSTLVDKMEVIMMEVLSPFSYTTIGLLTDVHAMSSCWSCVGPLFMLALVGYSSKLISVVVTTWYLNMPFREGLTLGLMLSLRGQVEFLLYLHWMDWKMVKTPNFTMMVLLTIVSTGVISSLISFLYDPTRPYMTNKIRTIQHNYPNSKLRIVASIYDEESVASLLSLLNVSNPSVSSPFAIYAIYVIELIGRASPVFIDHSQQAEYWDSSSEAIHHALNLYEENQSDSIEVQFFTSVAPQKTMYQDICELALVKKASLIILPFHKKHLNSLGVAGEVRRGMQSVNSNCLLNAPCSVGILVSKTALERSVFAASTSCSFPQRFVMLFLGGADAREALVYADRMVGDRRVSLTVIRFLTHNLQGDNEKERKLDDGVVTAFWVKNETNERVVYKEVVVSNGGDTLSAIQALDDGSYDLWIVGRGSGINPLLLHGLSNWNESPELGVIGDILASMDFSTTSSVLVVQQQVLRDDQRKSTNAHSSFCVQKIL
ncbi:hypothetical protein Ancab_007204 [Ancistrocladus abbreviatus]